MLNSKQLIVSHAPFWHNGSSIREKNLHIILAALPAVLFGIHIFGVQALAVMAWSVATAMLWEMALCKMMKRPVTLEDGNAMVVGLLFGMLLPATVPWWVVLTGTFIAIVIGQQIFGGIGSNPFHPAVLAISIVMISWKPYFNFNQALIDVPVSFNAFYPLAALKFAGVEAIQKYALCDLLFGQQIGGIGAICGIALIAGGIYLMARGFIRWEVSISFLVGIALTAAIFQQVDPTRFVGPGFHLLTGYTLLGAFFLMTEDSSSPVNFWAMIIFGLGGGLMTVLIRNIGVHIDGVLFAVLTMNLLNPLLDKIRPKAIGKVN